MDFMLTTLMPSSVCPYKLAYYLIYVGPGMHCLTISLQRHLFTRSGILSRLFRFIGPFAGSTLVDLVVALSKNDYYVVD